MLSYGWLNAQSLLGIGVIIAVCWALSESRRQFPWRLVLGGIAAQIVLVLIFFAFPQSKALLEGINGAVDALNAATLSGTQFIFGYLAGGPQPYVVENQGALFVFAFQVLPLILVISALSALLWHWNVLKWVIRGFGFVFEKTMGLGGASALAVACNLFLGMIESPIVIRGYLDKLTRSELFLLMTVGLATVAGSTMVAYALILRDTLPNAAGHVLAASIISAPAGIVLSRIMVPQQKDEALASIDYNSTLKYDGSIDAISKGTADGLMVVLNISAILIVFVALVALLNGFLGLLPDVAGAPITLERILSVIFAPLAWLIGIDWREAQTAGYVLGTKLTVTEFMAFITLGNMPVEALSERSRMILTYAICGFANIGSVGITVTGLGILIPERREEVMGMVWKALFAGFLATCLSASIVGAMPTGLF
ncbi:MAG: nucleoside transporter C-terminal domain-containing protein [Asticcacaulis sp.]